MSGLIWIETDWHPVCISERSLPKVDFETKQQATKIVQNYLTFKDVKLKDRLVPLVDKALLPLRI